MLRWQCRGGIGFVSLHRRGGGMFSRARAVGVRSRAGGFVYVFVLITPTFDVSLCYVGEYTKRTWRGKEFLLICPAIQAPKLSRLPQLSPKSLMHVNQTTLDVYDRSDGGVGNVGHLAIYPHSSQVRSMRCQFASAFVVHQIRTGCQNLACSRLPPAPRRGRRKSQDGVAVRMWGWAAEGRLFVQCKGDDEGQGAGAVKGDVHAISLPR